MNALSFQNVGGEIRITHDGTDRIFTVHRFREIVTTYLTYYREGVTDLSITLGYTLDAEIYGSDSPADFDADCQEYWSHRREMYQYVGSENLFPIMLVTHTADEADVDAVAQKCRLRLGQERCVALFDLWKSLDAQLAACEFTDVDQRTALLHALLEACRNSPVCATVPKIVLEDYGIADRREACKACFNYAMCHSESGSHYLTHRLTAKLFSGGFSTEELNTLRQSILAAVPVRNALLSRILGLES